MNLNNYHIILRTVIGMCMFLSAAGRSKDLTLGNRYALHNNS